MYLKYKWVDSWSVILRLTVGSDPWSLKDFPHSLYSIEYDLCKCLVQIPVYVSVCV